MIDPSYLLTFAFGFAAGVYLIVGLSAWDRRTGDTLKNREPWRDPRPDTWTLITPMEKRDGRTLGAFDK